MKKIKTVLLTCLFTATFISCKKTSTTTSPASSATNPNSTISPSSATSYYGIFSSGKSQSALGGILQSPTYFSDVYFALPLWFSTIGVKRLQLILLKQTEDN